MVFLYMGFDSESNPSFTVIKKKKKRPSFTLKKKKLNDKVNIDIATSLLKYCK